MVPLSLLATFAGGYKNTAIAGKRVDNPENSSLISKEKVNKVLPFAEGEKQHHNSPEKRNKVTALTGTLLPQKAPTSCLFPQKAPSPELPSCSVPMKAFVSKLTIVSVLQNQFWRPQKMGLVWSVPVPSKEMTRGKRIIGRGGGGAKTDFGEGSHGMLSPPLSFPPPFVFLWFSTQFRVFLGRAKADPVRFKWGFGE